MYNSLGEYEINALINSLYMLKTLKKIRSNGYSIDGWYIIFNPDNMYDEETTMLEGILDTLFPKKNNVEHYTIEDIKEHYYKTSPLKEIYENIGIYYDSYRVIQIFSDKNIEGNLLDKLNEVINKIQLDEYISDIIINENEIAIVNIDLYPPEMVTLFDLLIDIAKILKEE